MRRRFLFLCLLFPFYLFAQVSFEAVADAESILQGSTFQVTFQLRNADGSGFRPPDFSPFQVISGPSRSMQTSIINGAMSSSVGFGYVLTCTKIGSFTIPPASIVVRGKTLQTKPITIKVVKAIASASRNADVFIKAIADKEEVYPGEQFFLSYKLFTRVNIQNIEFATKPNTDAFQDEVVKLSNNPEQREIYEGREYITKVLSKSALYPVKTGMITIDPAVIRIVKGDNDPFGMGMPSLFRSEIDNVTTNELKIRVKELPQPRPEDFSGAVGDMLLQISPLNRSYTLNDAIHLSIQLRGDANFNLIKSDFVKLDTSFEISDSRSGDLIKVTDEPRITKTRKYDYLIVPKVIGDFVIKPGFVFFNPSKKAYERLQDSFVVKIIKGNASMASHDKEDIADIKRDIKLEYQTPTLLKDYKTWLLFCIPLGLLLFGFYKRNGRNYFAGKNSGSDTHLVSHTKDLSIENLERLIVHKVEQKYSLNTNTTSIASIKQFLQQKKNEDELAAKFLEIIQQLETMKYSGANSQVNLDQISRKISEL
jgi:hypothetical protein